MALDAEFFLTVHNQIISIISALGIMAGNTGYHTAVSMVDDPFTHRMSEFPLAGMAAGTDSNTIPLEHGRAPTAMGRMAGKTISHLFMTVFSALMTGNSILMTALA